ncbi:MAG: hypothetical protein JWQ83_680 [Lacunisphaera sp.]|nr:hypothetical protein [Lacunisphaera sp.]MDB6165540.1 hypothetical protein [Lacunisphaera sp.]
MNPLLFVFHLLVIAPAILGQSFGLDLATVTQPGDWPEQLLAEALGYLVLFGFVGILAVIVGFKLFDQPVPVVVRGDVAGQAKSSRAGG